MKNADGVPRCECGVVNPDVVLYEEGLDSGVIEHMYSGDLRSGHIDYRRYFSCGVSGGRLHRLFPGETSGRY